MNEIVGGQDVVFITTRTGFDVSRILDGVLEIWTEGLIQNAEEQMVLPLVTILAASEPFEPIEFFIYKDKPNADSWLENGWTEEHANGMVHFLINEDPNDSEKNELTLVIDSFTSETVNLIKAVSDALERMSPTGQGSADHPDSVDWESVLQAAGYTSGRNRFYEQVEKLHDELFRGWSANELACHPHDALQFCEAVRKKLSPVPDHFVMKALMNYRRLGRNGM